MKALIETATGAVEKPVFVLTLEEAQLLRDYEAWVQRNGYDVEVICADCESPMERHIDRDIGLICDCRMLFWKAS